MVIRVINLENFRNAVFHRWPLQGFALKTIDRDGVCDVNSTECVHGRQFAQQDTSARPTGGLGDVVGHDVDGGAVEQAGERSHRNRAWHHYPGGGSFVLF